MFSFALILLFIGGCTRMSSHFSYLNAKNKYRDGDYQTAVLSSLDALKIRSNNKRALELFETSSREIFIVFQDYIDNELEKNEPNWDIIISKYNILIDVSEKISRCQIPSVRVVYLSLKINPKDYKTERGEVISKAAEYNYGIGLSFLASNDRELIKKSASHFKKSLSYIPGYKDSQQKYEDSRKKALKSISISPFDNKVNNDTYSGISSQVSDKVETMLFNDSGFIEFINLVDRSKIVDVINEQKLSKSGLVDNQDIDVGMILGINKFFIIDWYHWFVHSSECTNNHCYLFCTVLQKTKI